MAELDDALGSYIAGGGLGAENKGLVRNIRIGILKNIIIKRNYFKVIIWLLKKTLKK